MSAGKTCVWILTAGVLLGGTSRGDAIQSTGWTWTWTQWSATVAPEVSTSVFPAIPAAPPAVISIPPASTVPNVSTPAPAVAAQPSAAVVAPVYNPPVVTVPPVVSVPAPAPAPAPVAPSVGTGFANPGAGMILPAGYGTSPSAVPITPTTNPTAVFFGGAGTPTPVSAPVMLAPSPAPVLAASPAFTPVAPVLAAPVAAMPVVAAPTPAPIAAATAIVPVNPPAVFSASTSAPMSTLPSLSPSVAPTLTMPSMGGAAAATPSVNAFLNFGSGNYAEANTLTTGGASSWLNSPVVQHVFGGTPTAAQQAAFQNQVVQDVQHTYGLGGLSVSLTTNPGVSAAHMISVVSGTQYGPNPNAIGITDVGHNGFDFIDKFSSAQNVSQLEWAVAHNISHELMHAFGIAIHHDQTGQYLDAASATWSQLTDPNFQFSAAAVADLATRNFNANGGSLSSFGGQGIDGDQMITPSPVPEPASVALWSVVGLGGWLVHRRRVRRAA